jgi:hypothetical protein
VDWRRSTCAPAVAPRGATRYGGNWSHYRARKAAELAAARRELAVAENRLARIARRAQAMVEREARKDRAAQRRRKRGDMPRIHMDRFKERSENTRGDTARQVARKHSQALLEAVSALRAGRHKTSPAPDARRTDQLSRYRGGSGPPRMSPADGSPTSANRSPADCMLKWWAREDSNLQPDRYERPALTVELRAPPHQVGDTESG